MTTIHVNAPSSSHTLKKHECPTCNKNSFMLGHHAMWYGTDWTCLGCGERFNEDGIVERPFMRGWRKKSIESAMWIIASDLDYLYELWLEKEMANHKGEN